MEKFWMRPETTINGKEIFYKMQICKIQQDHYFPVHTYLSFPLYASLEFQIFYKSWSIIWIIWWQVLDFQVSIWEIFYRSVEIFTREKTLDLSMSIRHKTRIVAVVGGHGFLDFQDLTSFVECECLTGPPKLSKKR